MKDIIEESNRIIKEKGSREAALGEEPAKLESSSSRSSRSNSYKSNESNGSDSGSEQEVDYGTMVINDEDGSDGDYDTGTMKSKTNIFKKTYREICLNQYQQFADEILTSSNSQ